MITLLFMIQIAVAAESPAPLPIFLREGYSSVLEFEEAPTQVILGDQTAFLVERLNRSLVVKPLIAYATTNMFVYFRSKPPRLFVLTAADEVEPTFYRKFSSVQVTPPPKAPVVRSSNKRGLRIKSVTFDKKKDFLTLDFEIRADSTGQVLPEWTRLSLSHKGEQIIPQRLWSQRREVQRDSAISVRLVFAKPDLAADLNEVVLLVPLKGEKQPLSLNLPKKRI